MSLSGTLTAPGTSARLTLKPAETCTFTLTVADSEAFEGIAALEMSRNGGQTWEPAVDITGASMRFLGADSAELEDTVVDTTIRNDETKPIQLRVRVAAIDPTDEALADDGIAYALTEVAGDLVEVLLRDDHGRPVLSRRDDGGLVAHGPVVLPSVELGGTTTVGDIVERVDHVEIPSAAITGTAAGQLGHANGVPLAAAPGADYALELVSAVMVNDRDTAAYGGGGNVTINWSGGGAAVTGLVSAANSLGAANDTRHLFVPLAAAAMPLVANAGFNLVAASAFTQPGTAAGVLRLTIRYRVHRLGLA